MSKIPRMSKLFDLKTFKIGNMKIVINVRKENFFLNKFLFSLKPTRGYYVNTFFTSFRLNLNKSRWK